MQNDGLSIHTLDSLYLSFETIISQTFQPDFCPELFVKMQRIWSNCSIDFSFISYDSAKRVRMEGKEKIS